MTSDPADLLLLRLEALKSDIAKVSAAVDRAEQRGQFLRSALDKTSPRKADIWAVSEVLDSLVKSMDREPRIAELLDRTRRNLARDVHEAPELLNAAAQAIDDGVASLKKAKRLSVILNDEGLRALRTSLKKRCEELTTKLANLRKDVVSTTASKRRSQWKEYQKLLDEDARPVFIDYVDFLGGLTVRDTGLDDQVCDMTDGLLTRYSGVIKRSLPLPARQAALGNVLDSVVLLGFPEWSIWGIPLVGHEVGMAYLRNKTDSELLDLASRFVPSVSPIAETKEKEGASSPPEQPTPTEQYIHHLIADAFATYTLGLSYASAALLLRLSPRHDECRRSDYPRDIDRARVIMMTLQSGTNIPAVGVTFSDSVGTLQKIWDAALRAHAGPTKADQATSEMAGPPPKEDWLDDLTIATLEHFSALGQVQPYDNERWQGSEKWIEPLKTGAESPSWLPYGDVVPDVLTAAWRLRLRGDAPVNLAENIKDRWSTGQTRG